MGEGQREMSLDEWVDRLPPSHRARKELAVLRAAAQPKPGESDIDKWDKWAAQGQVRGPKEAKPAEDLLAELRFLRKFFHTFWNKGAAALTPADVQKAGECVAMLEAREADRG